ncbi:hypothetical protein AYI69_g8712 [Smittium culicis]|uniref:Uncharacterized protein n=1 Tax=Smittium culicis TaxID=133412 RepID=A0A1R1XHS9_9FUNG|nr:hypothetical protein AYI69_g8712 [Smittium culicis]
MVIRKPVKRARTLFCDVLKGDDPQYPTNEVQNSYVGDYPRDNKHKLKKQSKKKLVLIPWPPKSLLNVPGRRLAMP